MVCKFNQIFQFKQFMTKSNSRRNFIVVSFRKNIKKYLKPGITKKLQNLKIQ